VPKISSTSCDQAVFVDQATDGEVVFGRGISSASAPPSVTVTAFLYEQCAAFRASGLFGLALLPVGLRSLRMPPGVPEQAETEAGVPVSVS
jgi:hypothetical protein